MRRVGVSGSCAALLALAACATPPPPAASPPGAHGRPPSFPTSQPPAAPVARAPVGGAAFAALPGWEEEDHAAALRAFQAGCGVTRDPAMRQVCARARALGAGVPEGAAKQFFQFNFVPAPLAGEGVLTGYFAPEYPARRSPEGAFTAPVRPRPSAAAFAAAPPPAASGADPVDTLLQAPAAAPPLASADRASIEAMPAPDALAWMRPEDLFFLQVQGSGVLLFPDGGRAKALYAGDNGRPFVAIARPMVRAGDLPPGRASADGIRAWLAAHAGPQAQAVMDLDPRYVFFRLAPDDGRDPAGAAGASLPPGRALAVDPSRHAYGELYWIDASAPVLNGAFARYRRLALALDTGSAIHGDIRADLYTGRGDAAGAEAGRVRHTLRLVRLVPVVSSSPGD
ncbi:MAG: MltA domain-containing protein [Caulobacteraceae bacterium]|nr:MltA domain-containing protein [Caulobacter sp.]